MGKSERHTKDPFTLIKVDEEGSGVAYIIAGLPSLRFFELIFSSSLQSVGHRIVLMNQRARTRTLARPKKVPLFQSRASSPARLADDGDRLSTPQIAAWWRPKNRVKGFKAKSPWLGESNASFELDPEVELNQKADMEYKVHVQNPKFVIKG